MLQDIYCSTKFNDKFGGNAELCQMARNMISNYAKNFNVTDIWHNLHHPKAIYIFYTETTQNIFPYLDYFLISDDHIGSTIITYFKIDHFSLEFTFDIEDNAKGPGI